ncbi:gliding motility lipoprotein GldD [Jiulongibacter sp. NS-SX5]|uniref:gliding motility lipoprotein GldD n=1 Tax=Jiulongibacter sp. NS-SX5 TaxID=3463854 RepID=UPI0040583B4C
MRIRKSSLMLLGLLSVLLWACGGEEVFVPKPKGFNRIELPAHEYQQLQENHPYTFEYSKHAVVKPDTFANSEPHWIILDYPDYDAIVQFTYKPLDGSPDKLAKHIDDAFKLAAKHHVKATSQREQIIELENGKRVVTIELEGEVPSHFQFYITDTTNHYLRGALYLMEPTLNDSLKPVVDYMKEDCLHLLETLNWK